MHFTKMQGAGNDYVLVETIGNHRDWSKLVQVICDRRYGVGADSLLVVLPSAKAQFRMRVFDPDGSEAESCGNGIRCLAKYVFEHGMVAQGAHQITVETAAGVRKISFHRKDGKLVDIQANMGEPQFAADEVPVKVRKGKFDQVKSMLVYPVTVDGVNLRLHLVSMGNPHAVHFTEQPVAEFPMEKLGPKVENLDVFPNRVNFEVARMLNRRRMEERVWERGVGETLACGTGACASTVAAQLLGYIDRKVDINLRGGMLKVEWEGTNGVMLSGPAEIVFEGEWPYEV